MVDKTHLEIKYALPYQPISAMELKWAVILGMAYVVKVSLH